jgi:hypothetical protein
MRKIKKTELPAPQGSIHKRNGLPDDLVRFSFRHFQANGKFCLPDQSLLPLYIQTLLDRLRSVSDMTISEFRTSGNKSLRSHSHDWAETTEPNGYAHLSQQLQSCQPWQFSLSANEHGRIHGILIDSVFYVVWLDPCHALYPKK